jgi:hypothetical protein
VGLIVRRGREATGVLLIVLATCTGGGGGEGTGVSPETTRAETDAPEPDSPEGLAMQAYRDGQDLLSDALAESPPNPDVAAFADYFTGSALSDTLGIVLDARQRGEFAETTAEPHPVVVSTTVNEVVLTDCLTETYSDYDLETGEQLESGTSVLNLRVRVVHEQETWRVSEITPREETCTP